MSEMVLRLPSSFVSVESDEMEYIDGGALYSTHYTNMEGIFSMGWKMGAGVAGMNRAVSLLIATGITVVGAIVAAGLFIFSTYNFAMYGAAFVASLYLYSRHGKYTINTRSAFSIPLFVWAS